MAKAKSAKAAVKATGKPVDLYRSKERENTWIDSSNNETEYKDHELENIKIDE